MDKSSRLDLLISLYVFCVAVSELMGAKTFALYRGHGLVLNASVAILVIPFTFLIADVVTEVYGRSRARGIVRSGLAVVFLILVFSLVATHLPASARFLSSEKAYEAVFAKTSRLAAASLIAFAVSELLDVAVFGTLRRNLRALWVRTTVASLFGQLADVSLFICLAFYAPERSLADNGAFLLGLILPYWLLRCALTALETPLVYAGIRWLRAGKEVA